MANSFKGFKLKLGDVFCVSVDAATKGYFQYVADDVSQMSSHVVKVFGERYPITTEPPLTSVVQGSAAFFAHVIIQFGLRSGLWSRVGNAPYAPPTDVLFRDSGDDGNPKVQVSSDWWIWRVGKPARRVGVLKGDDRKAYVGSVVPPDSLVHRMRTGVYDFVYPQMA